MDNPFTNLNFTKWYNMVATISFSVFILCVGALIGLYTPNDLEFTKTIMFFSLGALFISIGEISCRKTIPNEEIGDLHQIDPFTGESLGYISNIQRTNGEKEIRTWTVPGIIFYLIGFGFLFSSILE
ncbi:MAG: hypothetical protein DI602_09760 [Aliarcobacter butzleri]|nr:MAG: hypothetical protein DI602_09760 [Aliarcobacter butzleri]